MGKTESVADGQRHGRQGPSNRRRFVARAETLKGDRAFRAAIDRFRAYWDVDYPRYRLPKRAWWREIDGSPAVDALDFVPRPPRLQADESVLDEMTSEEQFAAFESGSEFYHRSLNASNAWKRIVEDLAEEWWPLDDFPHPSSFHPSSVFTALCVLYDIDSVPATTISTYGHEPRWAPCPPEDPTCDGPYRALQKRYDNLMSAIKAVAAGDEVMSPAEARRLEWNDLDAAFTSLDNTLAPLDPATGFWYVPIVPELTSRDWRDIEADAIATSRVRFGGDILANRIRHWHARGLSNRAVAARLGVTTSTVTAHLKASNS